MQQLYEECGHLIENEKDLCPIHPADYTEHRREVWEMLRSTHFVAMLSGGLETMPDIRETIPVILRPIYNLYYPRKVRDVVRHLLRNLDWYLNPKLAKRDNLTAWLQALLAMALAACLIYAAGVAVTQLPIISAFLIAAAVLNLVLTALRLGRDAAGGTDLGSMEFKANALELYRYLLEKHMPEVEVKAEHMLSQDLLKSTASGRAGDRVQRNAISANRETTSS